MDPTYASQIEPEQATQTPLAGEDAWHQEPMAQEEPLKLSRESPPAMNLNLEGQLMTHGSPC